MIHRGGRCPGSAAEPDLWAAEAAHPHPACRPNRHVGVAHGAGSWRAAFRRFTSHTPAMDKMLQAPQRYEAAVDRADPTETDFLERLAQARSVGRTVSRRGWPDFLLERDGQIVCVEVKARPKTVLSKHQRRVLHALVSYGVPCYRWSPTDGLVRLTVSDEDRRKARSEPTAVETLVAQLAAVAGPVPPGSGHGVAPG